MLGEAGPTKANTARCHFHVESHRGKVVGTIQPRAQTSTPESQDRLVYSRGDAADSTGAYLGAAESALRVCRVVLSVKCHRGTERTRGPCISGLSGLRAGATHPPMPAGATHLPLTLQGPAEVKQGTRAQRCTGQ